MPGSALTKYAVAHAAMVYSPSVKNNALQNAADNASCKHGDNKGNIHVCVHVPGADKLHQQTADKPVHGALDKH